MDTGAGTHDCFGTDVKRTSSVPLKRAMSRARRPPSMISPPSIDWSAISDAPTPLLRISAWPTALSPSSSVPTAFAARSSAVSVAFATARDVTAPSASSASPIEPPGVAASARFAFAERSFASSERSLTCLEVTVPCLMSPPFSSRSASAGPPSATNSAAEASDEGCGRARAWTANLMGARRRRCGALSGFSTPCQTDGTGALSRATSAA